MTTQVAMQSDRPLYEFAHAVQAISSQGIDGFGQPQTFVSREALRKYWTIPKIGQVLNAINLHIAKETVRDNYLRVFSTLVYSNRITSLSEFTEHGICDNWLPLAHLPHCWPDSPIHQELVVSFRSHQWKFCPLLFARGRLTNLHVPTEQILPLRKSTDPIAKQGEAAVIYKVELEESCNLLYDERTPPDGLGHTFVLKTYFGDRGRNLYNNERKAFTTLQDQPSSHIVGYYGSYIQNDTNNLVLEYVNGGNMLEFFRKTAPPTSSNDIRAFWTSFMGLFEGAHRIHQLTKHHEQSTDYLLVHQDIKPENILLSLEVGSSPYQFKVKIADFGYSHVRLANPNGEDKLGLDRQGGQMYSAPECSHHERYLHRGPNRITAEADIFSLGCLTSDAATWVTKGQPGRTEYLEARSREIDRLQSFKGSAYRGCFHNGVEMLQAVRDMHAHIKTQLPACDDMTGIIITIAEQYMLSQQPQSRLPARQLKDKFGHVLDGYFDMRDTTSQPLANETAPSSSLGTSSDIDISQVSAGRQVNKISKVCRPRPCGIVQSEPQNIPRINVHSVRPGVSLLMSCPSAVLDMDSKHIRSPRLSLGHTFRSSVNYLRNTWSPGSMPGLQELSSLRERSSLIEHNLTPEAAAIWRINKKNDQPVNPEVQKMISYLKSNLQGRDYIFLIDDSSTMASMSKQVHDAFTIMSYIAKQMDPNELELVFTSQPTKVYQRSGTRHLIEILQAHRYSESSTLMENSISKFVESVLIPRLPKRARGRLSGLSVRPLSLFVFTDGSWGRNRDKAAGVQRPINRLMTSIVDREIPRTQVMIQFVRFGDDGDGQRYLNYLDTFGRDKECDIVDTKSWRPAELQAMFIGSIDEEMDGRDELSDGQSLD